MLDTKFKEDTGDYDFYKTYLFFALFIVCPRLHKQNKKCA